MKTSVVLAIFCLSCAPARYNVESGALTQRTFDFYGAVMFGDVKKVESFMTPEYTLHFTLPNFQGWTENIPSVPRGRGWLKDWLPALKVTGGNLGWSMVESREYGSIGITQSHYHWSGTFKGVPFDAE